MEKIKLPNGGIALGETSRIEKSLSQNEINEILSMPVYSERNSNLNKTEKCHERAEALIPRWQQYFACVLPLGHEGEHKGGGCCIVHGYYVGTKGCQICLDTNYKEVLEKNKPKSNELIDGHYCDGHKQIYPYCKMLCSNCRGLESYDVEMTSDEIEKENLRLQKENLRLQKENLRLQKENLRLQEVNNEFFENQKKNHEVWKKQMGDRLINNK